MTNALKMAKTVQTILANLVCNAGKAGMQYRKSHAN